MSETIFWKKYCELCQKKGVSPTKAAIEMGLSNSAASNYKSGRIPTGEVIIRMSKYFDVSANYLISDEEFDINLSKKKVFDGFNILMWLPQRWASIRFGKRIQDSQMIDIALFTNSELSFLYSTTSHKFTPKENDYSYEPSLNTLELILGIMDRCDNNNDIKTLQTQLSYIVIYWLEKAGITSQQLIENRTLFHSVSLDKIKYLYNIPNIMEFDPTFKCGFNFTELDVIREATGLSFLYMFTGKTYEDIDRYLKEENAKLKAQLEALQSSK